MFRLILLVVLPFVFSCQASVVQSQDNIAYEPLDLVFFYPREYSELSHVKLRRHIVVRRAKELNIGLTAEECSNSWGELREELMVAAAGDFDDWAWNEYGEKAQDVLDFYQKQLKENLIYQKCLLMDLENEPTVELYFIRYGNKSEARQSFESLVLGQNVAVFEVAKKILCPKKLLSFLPQDGASYGPWKLVDNSWCIAQSFEAESSSAADFFDPMVGELWVLYWSNRYNN